MRKPDGADRYRNNRRRGIVDRAIKLPGDPEWSDRMSFDSEWFFGHRYGIEEQAQVKRPTPCDFVVGNAHLDVKWSTHDKAHLQQVPKDPPESTHFCIAYVLVIGKMKESFYIDGWAWGHELRQWWNPRLKVPAWWMPNEHLHRNVDLLMAATFGLTVRTT